MVLKGVVAAYKNAWLYKLFLDEALSNLDAVDILQESLFIILYYVEMISMSRLILNINFSINVPMRWISGKTHTFSTHDWSIKYMVRSIAYLYNAMLKLKKHGWNILDEQFKFNIFKPLKLKPLDDYVKYICD